MLPFRPAQYNTTHTHMHKRRHANARTYRGSKGGATGIQRRLPGVVIQTTAGVKRGTQRPHASYNGAERKQASANAQDTRSKHLKRHVPRAHALPGVQCTHAHLSLRLRSGTLAILVNVAADRELLHAVRRRDGLSGHLELARLAVRLEVHANRRADVDVARRLARDPRVLEDLVGREALLGIHHEHLLDHVLGRLRDCGPVRRVKLKVALHDLLEKHGVVVVVKRGITAQQNVRNHADGPEIDGLAVTLLPENLGGDIVGRAAGRLKAEVVVDEFGEAKVGDHDVRVRLLRPEEKVLGLEVSVHNIERVEVADGRRDLPHEARRVLLRETALVNDAIKELTALDVFEDEVELVGRVKLLVHAHNVRVLHLAQNGHLRLDHLLLALAELLVNHFDRIAAAALLLRPHVLCVDT
eukprot:Opistho-1_new@64398